MNHRHLALAVFAWCNFAALTWLGLLGTIRFSAPLGLVVVLWFATAVVASTYRRREER